MVSALLGGQVLVLTVVLYFAAERLIRGPSSSSRTACVRSPRRHAPLAQALAPQPGRDRPADRQRQRPHHRQRDRAGQRAAHRHPWPSWRPSSARSSSPAAPASSCSTPACASSRATLLPPTCWAMWPRLRAGTRRRRLHRSRLCPAHPGARDPGARQGQRWDSHRGP